MSLEPSFLRPKPAGTTFHPQSGPGQAARPPVAEAATALRPRGAYVSHSSVSAADRLRPNELLLQGPSDRLLPGSVSVDPRRALLSGGPTPSALHASWSSLRSELSKFSEVGGPQPEPGVRQQPFPTPSLVHAGDSSAPRPVLAGRRASTGLAAESSAPVSAAMYSTRPDLAVAAATAARGPALPQPRPLGALAPDRPAPIPSPLGRTGALSVGRPDYLAGPGELRSSGGGGRLLPGLDKFSRAQGVPDTASAVAASASSLPASVSSLPASVSSLPAASAAPSASSLTMAAVRAQAQAHQQRALAARQAQAREVSRGVVRDACDDQPVDSARLMQLLGEIGPALTRTTSSSSPSYSLSQSSVPPPPPLVISSDGADWEGPLGDDGAEALARFLNRAATASARQLQQQQQQSGQQRQHAGCPVAVLALPSHAIGAAGAEGVLAAAAQLMGWPLETSPSSPQPAAARNTSNSKSGAQCSGGGGGGDSGGDVGGGGVNSLRALDLSNNPLGTDGVRAVARFVGRCAAPSLESLRLRNMIDVDADGQCARGDCDNDLHRVLRLLSPAQLAIGATLTFPPFPSPLHSLG